MNHTAPSKLGLHQNCPQTWRQTNQERRRRQELERGAPAAAGFHLQTYQKHQHWQPEPVQPELAQVVAQVAGYLANRGHFAEPQAVAELVAQVAVVVPVARQQK